MEIFIGALIVAGVAWIFVRHYNRKSEVETAEPKQEAPYKVETPPVQTTTAEPVPVQAAPVTATEDGRWPFPTSTPPTGAENRVEAPAPAPQPVSKARVKNTTKEAKEAKPAKQPKTSQSSKVVKMVKVGDTPKEPKMAKEAKPKAPKVKKAAPALTVVDNKSKTSKK